MNIAAEIKKHILIFTHYLDYHASLISYNTHFLSTSDFWNALIVLIEGFLYYNSQVR